MPPKRCYLPEGGFPPPVKVKAKDQFVSAKGQHPADVAINDELINSNQNPDVEKIGRLLQEGASANAHCFPCNCNYHTIISLGNDSFRGYGENTGFCDTSKTPEERKEDYLRRTNLAVQLIKMFQTKGVDPNLISPTLNTPLESAVDNKVGLDIFKALIDGGANVDLACCRTGVRPLHLLSTSCNQWEDGVKILEYFIKDCHSDVNLCDREFSSPLHFAARCMNPTSAQILLDNGADPLVQDKKKRTPATLAAENLESYRKTFSNHTEKIEKGEQVIALLLAKENEWKEREAANNNATKKVSKTQLAAAAAKKKAKKETEGIGAGKEE